jgi:hypothetical protein
MPRSVVGKRHEINYQFAVCDGLTKVQATCVCGRSVGPPRFGRERAEQDGDDHLYEFVRQGKPPKGRGK